MNKRIIFFTFLLLCSSSIIIISSCNKDEVALEVTNLALKNAPTNMNYYEGDILDLSGLIITLTMDNGESKDIAFKNFEKEGITCFPINGTKITEKTTVIITHVISGNSVNVTLNYMIVTDADGNNYEVVRIGSQFWMAENLKTTQYANGEEITDGREVQSSTIAPQCWYAYNDNIDNVSTYGRLYTWYAVTDSRNVCPTGWHVPTDSEWTKLTNFLGSEVGGKLKETGTMHWISPNTGATNETGFTALPAGSWYYAGDQFYDLGTSARFWSTTEGYLSQSAIYRLLEYNDSELHYSQNQNAYSALSVRCVRNKSFINF